MRIINALTLSILVTIPAPAAEIHEAAEADDTARIKELLAADPKLVHLAGKDDLTPLHAAARAGKLKAMALLLEAGADVNAADQHEQMSNPPPPSPDGACSSASRPTLFGLARKSRA